MNTDLYDVTSVLDRAVIDTLERHTARMVLMSPDIDKVRLAIHLLSCDVMESLAVEIVDHVLMKGSEDIIRTIAEEPCFRFREYAPLAFAGDLEVRASGDVTWYPQLPVHVLSLLIRMSDEGMLTLDFPDAIEHAIKRGDHNAVMLLCARPEAMLFQYGQDYLLAAVYDGIIQLDSLLFLLDQEEIEIDTEIIADIMWDVEDDTELYTSLLVHPRTRQYVIEYEANEEEHQSNLEEQARGRRQQEMLGYDIRY